VNQLLTFQNFGDSFVAYMINYLPVHFYYL